MRGAALSISNPRDLVVQFLGELLYVERRLADEVIQALADRVQDEELRGVLEVHRGQTKEHVERVETVFRRIEVAPTSNRSAAFESAVSEHDEVAESIVQPRLADLFHAKAALHVEHWEAAAYRSLLPLLPRAEAQILRRSFREEGDATKLLVAWIDQAAESARLRDA
jgi:ferritin-like metal-binding protein YciE